MAYGPDNILKRVSHGSGTMRSYVHLSHALELLREHGRDDARVLALAAVTQVIREPMRADRNSRRKGQRTSKHSATNHPIAHLESLDGEQLAMHTALHLRERGHSIGLELMERVQESLHVRNEAAVLREVLTSTSLAELKHLSSIVRFLQYISHIDETMTVAMVFAPLLVKQEDNLIKQSASFKRKSRDLTAQLVDVLIRHSSTLTQHVESIEKNPTYNDNENDTANANDDDDELLTKLSSHSSLTSADSMHAKKLESKNSSLISTSSIAMMMSKQKAAKPSLIGRVVRSLGFGKHRRKRQQSQHVELQSAHAVGDNDSTATHNSSSARPSSASVTKDYNKNDSNNSYNNNDNNNHNDTSNKDNKNLQQQKRIPASRASMIGRSQSDPWNAMPSQLQKKGSVPFSSSSAVPSTSGSNSAPRRTTNSRIIAMDALQENQEWLPHESQYTEDEAHMITRERLSFTDMVSTSNKALTASNDGEEDVDKIEAPVGGRRRSVSAPAVQHIRRGRSVSEQGIVHRSNVRARFDKHATDASKTRLENQPLSMPGVGVAGELMAKANNNDSSDKVKKVSVDDEEEEEEVEQEEEDDDDEHYDVSHLVVQPEERSGSASMWPFSFAQYNKMVKAGQQSVAGQQGGVPGGGSFTVDGVRRSQSTDDSATVGSRTSGTVPGRAKEPRRNTHQHLATHQHVMGPVTRKNSARCGRNDSISGMRSPRLHHGMRSTHSNLKLMRSLDEDSDGEDDGELGDQVHDELSRGNGSGASIQGRLTEGSTDSASSADSVARERYWRQDMTRHESNSSTKSRGGSFVNLGHSSIQEDDAFKAAARPRSKRHDLAALANAAAAATAASTVSAASSGIPRSSSFVSLLIPNDDDSSNSLVRLKTDSMSSSSETDEGVALEFETAVSLKESTHNNNNNTRDPAQQLDELTEDYLKQVQKMENRRVLQRTTLAWMFFTARTRADRLAAAAAVVGENENEEGESKGADDDDDEVANNDLPWPLE